MKTSALIGVAVPCLISLFSPAAFNQAGPKFSSAYTDLKTQCKSTAAGEAQGDDPPLRCAGYGGYEIRIDFSAAGSHLRAQPVGNKTDGRIDLAAQPLSYPEKRKIEWRLAGGKPFALIFRVEKSKEGVDPAMWRPENKAGEVLLVKGLAGYGHINFEVDAHTPDANVKARRLADDAYARGR